jgi:hypothetical protein
MYWSFSGLVQSNRTRGFRLFSGANRAQHSMQIGTLLTKKRTFSGINRCIDTPGPNHCPGWMLLANCSDEPLKGILAELLDSPPSPPRTQKMPKDCGSVRTQFLPRDQVRINTSSVPVFKLIVRFDEWALSSDRTHIPGYLQ